MQINNWMGQHNALASLSNSKTAQNNRGGEHVPDQSDNPAANNPAAIASFGQIDSYWNRYALPSGLYESVQEQVSDSEDLLHKDIEAYITDLRAKRAEPKPELQLALYERDSIAYGLSRAFDKMLGYLFEKYNINEQLEANTWEGDCVGLGGLKGTLSNVKQVLDNNPVFKEFQILNGMLQKPDENGRTAFHEIGDMLITGANATTNMPNASAEERAMQREAVVRMATEIADSYGFTDEVANPFMTEVYRQLGKDSAIDSGAAIMRFDKYDSIQFINTPDTKWPDFLRDNVSDEVRKEIEKVIQKPIDFDNLDQTTLDSILFVIGYNDYGLRQEMFVWSFMNDSLAKDARANFDSAISDAKFTDVKQWQSEMREWHQQFLTSMKE